MDVATRACFTAYSYGLSTYWLYTGWGYRNIYTLGVKNAKKILKLQSTHRVIMRVREIEFLQLFS
ncbi:MAG TPA: hypothetical protein ENG47_06870 [Candidatus Aerophobetes bacterium]|uniref:Uncharacterized protein n=1 Tax=Aerophobetes bacterium TaxID=2030807 RepID=A0A7V0QSH4_UNCAE|nr:hypothetical protein [Candidatus Aerophobetes bacterium]